MNLVYKILVIRGYKGTKFVHQTTFIARNSLNNYRLLLVILFLEKKTKSWNVNLHQRKKTVMIME
jgi:hypothetical protein